MSKLKLSGGAVVSFLFGAATGGTVAAFLMKRTLDKKYARIAKEKEDLERYIQFLRDRDMAGYMAENLQYISNGEIGDRERPVGNVKPSTDQNGQIDYTKCYKGVTKKGDVNVVEEAFGVYPREEDEGDEDPQPDAYEGTHIASGQKPEEIDISEFDALPHYETTELCYYTDDDTLVIAENDEIVDDREALLGDTLYGYGGREGFATDDRDLMYVRNYDRQTDYSVEKIFNAYHDTL